MEGLAVGALVHSGILFMGSYKNAVQRAVVGIIAMVDTLLNGALNALIGVTAHLISLLL